jgi:phage shock protein A
MSSDLIVAAKALLAQQQREELTEELREEVKSLREKNKELKRNWDDAEQRLDANVDDRERVIAHKSQIIVDLDMQRLTLERRLEESANEFNERLAKSEGDHAGESSWLVQQVCFGSRVV